MTEQLSVINGNRIKLDIVMPHRIGDCILTLPAIKCLNLLNKKFSGECLNITFICGKFMLPFIKKQDIGEVKELNLINKLKSIFFPADKMFCYFVSSKIIGLRGIETYGQNRKNKKYLNFMHNIPYLLECDSELFPDKELAEYMRVKYGFSDVIINNFALCLELGYSSNQIKEALCIVMNEQPRGYIVMCLEAGYNKKRCSSRRAAESFFFETADYIYQKYNLESVFIGIGNSPILPERSYFKDARGTKTISELEQIIQNSKGYIGNDTGPLHLANFHKKPCLGVYMENIPKEYGPLYPEYNFPVIRPSNADEIKRKADEMFHKDYE